MMEQPILVTGGSGFIGRHLVSALLLRGDRVRVLVRRPEAARSLSAIGAEAVVGDMLDPNAVRRAADGVGGVFHLAGRLFVAGSGPEEYARLHVDATVALMNACTRAANPPDYFVLCSTTGVLGPTGVSLASEDDLGHPQNAYEQTKARAERDAREIANRSKVPLVVARPGLVYGPGDQHLLNWFRSIRGGYYRVIGSGLNHLHPIYVDDVVRALLLCPSAASAAGRAYHLVGANAVSMREFSDAIGHAVGRRVPKVHIPAPLAFTVGAALEALPLPRHMLPLTRSRVRFMLQNRAYDGTRAREELGFVPEVDLAEGLSRTIAWYRANRLL
jgi:nucleoside-diphosphate-sugar epimerase